METGKEVTTLISDVEAAYRLQLRSWQLHVWDRPSLGPRMFIFDGKPFYRLDDVSELLGFLRRLHETAPPTFDAVKFLDDSEEAIYDQKNMIP